MSSTSAASSSANFPSTAGNAFGIAIPIRSADGDKTQGAVLSFNDTSAPDFSRYIGNATSAAEIVAAARAVAARTENSEIDRLLIEHRELATEAVMGRLTESKRRRLDYVRWSIDRIEDARSGAALDALQAQLERYRQLGEDLKKLTESVERIRV